MRVAYMSDLHIDSGQAVDDDLLNVIKSRKDEFDCIIIAGDVSNSPWTTSNFLARVSSACGKKVIFVMGNHEYYKSNIGYTKNVMDIFNRRKEYKGKIFILDDTGITLNHEGRSHLFVGGTLWSDFEIMKEPFIAKREAQRGMSDFHVIKNDDNSILSPDDAIKMHNNTLDEIGSLIVTHRASHDTVNVVTHHAPSWRSVADRYRNSFLTSAFSSAILDEGNVAYRTFTYYVNNWFHGHVHDSFEYEVEWDDDNKTAVHCNPKGYDHFEENPEFSTIKIVEI